MDLSELNSVEEYEVSREHDEEIAEEPPYSCPSCGKTTLAIEADAEEFEHWTCVEMFGGCGGEFAPEAFEEVPDPQNITLKDFLRYGAWGRLQVDEDRGFPYDKIDSVSPPPFLLADE